MAHALVADLYQLTMASGYLRRGMTSPATFSLFARRLPPDRAFIVSAGIEAALDYIEGFGFDDDELAWLLDAGFDAGTVDAFSELAFDGDVWAVPEGRAVFANEPLLEITAPLPVAQLLETVVLNQITYQSALVSKAARCTIAAAEQCALVDFSFRRTHGVEAGMAAARAGIMAGFAGTSNVEAARRFSVPAVGTMAHSFVEAFATERQAFEAYAEDFPDRSTFLVDTYDTERGVQTAIEVISDMGLHQGVGIRLDSGDLLELSKMARRLLDDAGLADTAIVASGGCDEFVIADLLERGAPIDVFGVGTTVGVSADAPTLDTAYKLVDLAGRPVMKLSPGKETRPGPKQVHRWDLATADVLAGRSEAVPPGAVGLLEPMIVAGERVRAPDTLDAARSRLRSELDALPSELRRLRDPVQRSVEVSPFLDQLTTETARLHRPRTPVDGQRR